MTRKIHSKLASCLLVASTVMMNSAATGQTSEADTAPSQGSTLGIEEIIVTAEKRESRLQDVPLSITAFGEDQLDRLNIDDFDDLANFVPGIGSTGVGPGRTSPILRGVSANAGQPTVAYYIDETPVSENVRVGNPDTKFFDVNRVEVLRGPQGSLYGARSMGGTIKVVTNRPDLDSFEARMDGSVSSTKHGGENLEFNSMLNVPVIEGKFGARLVGLYRFKSGVIDRIDPDILTLPADDDPDPTVGNDPDLANETFKDRDIDEEKTHGGRIALKWSATDDLEVATTFWAQRTEMGGLQERDSSFGDRLRTTRLLPDPFWSTFVNSNLTLAYRLPFSANVLVSANKFTRAFSETLDTTEFVRGIFGQTVPTPLDTTGDSDEYSVEARVTSDLGGSLEYIIGAYYLDKDRQFNQLLIANGLSDVLGIPIANDLLLSFNQTVREEEKALFGQLSYQIRDKLTLTLGLRWFDYENTNQGTRVGLFGANPLDVIAQEDDINPKFTVSYKIDEDKMIFATASQGFRPGFGINVFFPPSCDQDLLDLNIDPANLPTQTNADTLWNYDIGFKSATANNRLILNATAYYLDWTDIQQRITLPTCGFFLTGNAGEASSKGVELELYSQPFANVDLTATVGYVDAKLENDAVELGGQQGDRLTNVPELTFATMLRYNFVVGSNYDASIQAEYQHTGNSHVSFNFANPLDEKPAFEILNLRFRVRLNEWEGHLFVENVLDERAALSISGFGTAPNVRRVGTNDPRTIGLRISRQF